MESHEWDLEKSSNDTELEEKYPLVAPLPAVLHNVNFEVIERFIFITFQFIRKYLFFVIFNF